MTKNFNNRVIEYVIGSLIYIIMYVLIDKASPLLEVRSYLGILAGVRWDWDCLQCGTKVGARIGFG